MTFDNTVAMQCIGGGFVVFLVLEMLSGEYKKKSFWTIREVGTNVFSFLNFLVVRFFLLGLIAWLLLTLFPTGGGFMSDWPFWPIFLAYLLVEEYLHYWVHRLAHEHPLLWRFHKPHHTPEILNMTVSFRENWIWFLLTPNAWLGAVMVWGGQLEAAMIGAAIKGCSEWMVHSSLRWDLALQRNVVTRRFMWVVERIVTLPDTHHVHHGIGKYGNAMGNYGSFLFLFDMLHGTGTIPHRRQQAYGLPQGVYEEPWWEQLWWPFVRVKKEKSVRSDRQLDNVEQDLSNAKASIITFDGRVVPVTR